MLFYYLLLTTTSSQVKSATSSNLTTSYVVGAGYYVVHVAGWGKCMFGPKGKSKNKTSRSRVGNGACRRCKDPHQVTSGIIFI